MERDLANALLPGRGYGIIKKICHWFETRKGMGNLLRVPRPPDLRHGRKGLYRMNVPPTYFPAPGGAHWPYQQEQDRRAIRKMGNRLCWLIFLFTPLVFLFQKICVWVVGAAGATQYGDPAFGGLPPSIYYTASALPYFLALAVPALVFLCIQRQPWDDLLLFRRGKLSTSLLFVVAGVGLCLLANYPASLIGMLEESFGFDPSISYGPISADPAVMALYFVDIAVVPALSEELMFRGVLLGSLRRYGDGFAVAGSAILFGLWHGNFTQFAFAFLCGLVMGLAVIKCRTLWVSILIHFLNNGISCGLSLAGLFYDAAAIDSLYAILMPVILVLALLALILLVLRNRRLFSLERGPSPLRLSSKLGSLFGNAGGILFAAYSVLLAIWTLAG